VRTLLASGPDVDALEILNRGRALQDECVKRGLYALDMVEEKMLNACVDDEAGRYCVCNGFNDGRFMVECEECEEWFHGRCVQLSGVDEEAAEATADGFTCPKCCEKQGRVYEHGTQQADGGALVVDKVETAKGDTMLGSTFGATVANAS
jgi:hypothetical protein